MDKYNKRLYSNEGFISVEQSFEKINHDLIINSGLTEFQPLFEIDWKTWRRLGFEITTNKISSLYQNRRTKTNLASVVSTNAKHCDEKRITFHDMSLIESRQGAPSSYKVDFVRSELYALRWRYKNERLMSGSYWAKMISEFPQLYNPTFCGLKMAEHTNNDVKRQREKIVLSPINDLPSPAYLIKYTFSNSHYTESGYSTHWKWRRKRVRIGHTGTILKKYRQ